MLSIGDLARHTRVSARMLRHYDALGLVTPERVDESTGYRWYAASQIGRVNSVVALKELGFTLEQCRSILDERVGVGDLVALLRLRQAELAQRIEADTARLAEVGRRLRSIERGLTVTNESFQLKELPRLRLMQASAEVNDISEIGTMTAVLLDRVSRQLSAATVPPAGPRVQTYYGRPDGSKIDVAVGWPVGVGGSVPDGLDVVELPEERHGACVVHHGPASDIADAWQAFDVALEQRDLEPYGVSRQVHLHGDAPDDVVVELQCPVRPRGSLCG
ncbi:MerR family transcriptional regulator [Couchioplanes caeruleus]|uniref:MerR family transcriptional regulator n=1 Tax=Couchioplanes caeruleus TaxID=56438 RepID=UPI0023DE79ED|nr:MerR family transcriptional regulator [Couchioplanes caeruleus]